MYATCMPQKNSRKIYYENAFYHVYNRGVEKRNIFLDRDDHLAFFHFLKTALSPIQGGTLPRNRRKKFHDKIDLMAYCLMPNHYHLLLRQKTISGLTEFIRSLSTSYSMYFNKKYRRVGSLFQGVFKATDIRDEKYLLWVSRYIHRNPPDFQTYPYSSYYDYLSKRKTDWLNTHLLLEFFESKRMSREKNYQEFVDNTKEETPSDFSFITLEPENEEDEVEDRLQKASALLRSHGRVQP